MAASCAVGPKQAGVPLEGGSTLDKVQPPPGATKLKENAIHGAEFAAYETTSGLAEVLAHYDHEFDVNGWAGGAGGDATSGGASYAKDEGRSLGVVYAVVTDLGTAFTACFSGPTVFKACALTSRQVIGQYKH